MDGILPVSVCVEEDEAGFSVRCDRLGDHAWRGATVDAALEEFARDLQGMMDLYWSHRAREA